MKLCVTGSASHLARVLLPRLLADTRVSSVLGIDYIASPLRHSRFTPIQADIRDPALGTLLAGCDALIHLAFVVLPRLAGRRLDRAQTRDINVNGSRNVFEQARRAGIAQLIHVSSAAVYGAGTDKATDSCAASGTAQQQPFKETDPLRPHADFGYAQDKAAVEQMLDTFQQHPDSPRVTCLRPHVILGPHAQPLLRFLLRQPFFLRLPEPQPLTQCVWEDDIVDALLRVLFMPVSGTFNISAQPAITFKEMQQLTHRFSWPLPYPLARGIHSAAWWLSPAAGEPAWLRAMRQPLIVNTDKARDELGWQARSTRDCLRQLFARPAGTTPDE